MTNEIREQLAKVFRANADKQLSLSKVIETTCTALRADKTGLGSLYADYVGESRSEERKRFLQVFFQQMPHVVYNGTDKVVVVDWVESEEDCKKPIRQYRLAGEPLVNCDECIFSATTTKEIKRKEIVTLQSGFVIEVASRDADGNYITEQKEVRLVPREKSAWGYTDTVMQAFIVAIELIAG